jgi:PBP1b-binding outer membrane lipoprotein LpoB
MKSMKKILSMVVVLAFLVMSCGPSQKELQEKAKADSIHQADSIALVVKQKAVADSLALVDAEKAKADSLAKLPKVKTTKKTKTVKK